MQFDIEWKKPYNFLNVFIEILINFLLVDYCATTFREQFLTIPQYSQLSTLEWHEE